MGREGGGGEKGEGRERRRGEGGGMEGRGGKERRDLYTLHSLEFITVSWSLYDTTLQTTDMPLILPQSVDRDI